MLPFYETVICVVLTVATSLTQAGDLSIHEQDSILLGKLDDLGHLKNIYDAMHSYYNGKGSIFKKNIQATSCYQLSYTILVFLYKYGLPTEGKTVTFDWELIYVPKYKHVTLRTRAGGCVVDWQGAIAPHHLKNNQPPVTEPETVTNETTNGRTLDYCNLKGIFTSGVLESYRWHGCRTKDMKSFSEKVSISFSKAEDSYHVFFESGLFEALVKRVHGDERLKQYQKFIAGYEKWNTKELLKNLLEWDPYESTLCSAASCVRLSE